MATLNTDGRMSTSSQRKIIFVTALMIVILLFYMESNLLSFGNDADNEDVLLMIGNDQDLMKNKQSPYLPKATQNATAIKSTTEEEDTSPKKVNDSDWDKERKWYHYIESNHTLFNVTWHILSQNQKNKILNGIDSETCTNMNNFHNFSHSLHPNFDQIDLLPLPRNFELFSQQILIKGKRLKFECNLMSNRIIKHAINKYIPLMFDHIIDEKNYENINDYFMQSVHINIKNTEQIIKNSTTDESYSIFIPFSLQCHTIYISANTIFGALHSLETLSQIIEYDFDQNMFFLKYVGMIFDFPYYSYRGVMLDSARHFYPVRSIKKFIDSIAYTKFNVLHWHVSDDQSWPFPLKIYPNLVKNASWSMMERYSMNDVLDIIDYAKLNGLRVIPEFDSPAHAGAICKVLDVCMNEYCTRSSDGLLDPTKNGSVEVLFNIYREVMGIFDDEYIHIGHDEADYKLCFKKNAKLKQFVRDNVPSGKTRSKQHLGVYYFWLDKIYNFIKREQPNKIMMAWDDIWFRLRKKFEIPNDIILIFWRNAWKTKFWQMASMNFSVIMSEPFYIDLTYNDLKRRYFWDLWMVEEDKKNKKESVYQEWWRQHVLGGQACVWSERIDESVLYAKLFPDLSAIAENLWIGGENVKNHNWQNVKQRLKWHRCLLLRRRIGGSPIESNRSLTYFNRQPVGPGSCLEQ